MKNSIYILTVFSLLITNCLYAQETRVITSGIVEFEKNVNIYGLIKQQVGKNPDIATLKRIEEYKNTHPQFRKLRSTLSFSKDKSIFTPLPNDDNERILGNDNPMATQSNIVYTDFNKKKRITQKTIYEHIYLVTDTVKKIKWKITDETREIAGFNCRRANGIILDSVYVVAYYTNEIAISAGPESFSGLPGMILGLALPHENVQWFANRVIDTSIPNNKITAPTKGKSITYSQLLEVLKSAMKDWGRTGPYEIKVFSL